MSEPRASSGGSRAGIALLLPPLAWVLFEYGLASSLRPACDAVGSWLGPAWGVASLIACAAAAWIARPLANGAADGDASRRWLARIALLGSGIFALAIAFQTLATLIVPSCVR